MSIHTYIHIYINSTVIALLEFAKFASVRELTGNAEWDNALRRLEVWKRVVTMIAGHRQADLQYLVG